MKLKLSILALLVTGVTGCNSTPQSGLEQSLSWGNYGSLSFETSSEGIVAQRYQVLKSPVGQITSIEEQGNQIHVIQTLEGALIKGVDSTGIMNYEGCMESVGEVDAAVNAYPSIVQFLLKQAAPQGPNSVSTSLPFTVSESANNAQIYIGEATSVEIEGESYPIGPMIELSAPWGASGQITSVDATTFEFSYFTTNDGHKDTVDIRGAWSQSMGPMDKFNQEPSGEWLACVKPEVQAVLMEQSPKRVGEILEIITKAELANDAI
ncbi:hypothetical protein AB6E16_05050 [Vibrio atlanticus]|uniref:Uncharacterized protein n=1 Tax=Vibrio atlanticus TaxID=693153 RepID=A0ABV4KNP4_9VIBR